MGVGVMNVVNHLNIYD